MNRLLPLGGTLKHFGGGIASSLTETPQLMKVLPGFTATTTSSLCLNHQQVRCKCQAGRYKVTLKRNRPLTYEMANKPHNIGARKGWNSWNTTSLTGAEFTASEVTIDDMFIRSFLSGTWHRLFLSEVIIKRRANAIIINGIVYAGVNGRKIYWLIGYTEEILSLLLKCPVKVDIQMTGNRNALVYKYI